MPCGKPKETIKSSAKRMKGHEAARTGFSVFVSSLLCDGIDFFLFAPLGLEFACDCDEVISRSWYVAYRNKRRKMMGKKVLT